MAFSGLDQAIFGVGGYAVSWSAARWLDAPGLAVYAIAWQWGFGIAAVLSEIAVTPAMVRTAGRPTEARTFELSFVRTFGLVGLVAGAVAAVGSLAVQDGYELVLWTASLAIVTFTYAGSRGLRYARGDIVGSVRIGVTRALLTGALLGLVVSSGRFEPITALAIGVTGALLPLALVAGARNRRRRRAFGEIREGLRAGVMYGIATTIRVVGFSAGLLSLVAVVRGLDVAAVIAGLLIIAGPVQLLSASLPMLFIAELSPIPADEPDRWRTHMGQQVVLLTGLLTVGLVVAWVVFGPWVRFSVGEVVLREQLVGEFPAFIVLISGITFSTWVGAVLKAQRRPLLYTLSGAGAGLVTLLAVFSPLPVTTLTWLPYWLTVLAVVPAIRRLRPHGPRRDSLTG